MEVENREQIADEVRQLCAQYAAEVPSKRRTWPKSIKERVFQLLDLEVRCEVIAAQTGIPVATIYGWKCGRGQPQAFLPVQVVADKAVTLQSKSPSIPKPRRRKQRQRTPTIIVVAPNGVRFEGLNIAGALEIAAALGFGS